MTKPLWTHVITAASAALLSCAAQADQRDEWGTPYHASAPLDDEALMQVSAQGIHEDTVKQLRRNGKLTDTAAQSGVALATLTTALAESAEKQAVQTQYKMAMGAAQTVTSSIQLAGVVTAVAAPVPFVPVMTMPLFGLPLLPPKSGDK